jgi:hypothetical protein
MQGGSPRLNLLVSRGHNKTPYRLQTERVFCTVPGKTFSRCGPGENFCPAAPHLVSGYGCFSLDPGSTNVQIVSGDDFLPDKMCICLKGWFGNGTSCNRCGKNTYSNVTNAASCESCPPDSHTEKVGAKSRFECACTIGKSIKNGTACGCRELFALHDGVCVSCPELNLDCSTEGLIAITAPPQDGFARLDLGCKCAQLDYGLRGLPFIRSVDPC